MAEKLFNPQCLRLITLLKQGDRERAGALAAAAADQRGAEWAYLHMLIPSVYAIGELFVAGGIGAEACDKCVKDVLSVMEQTRTRLARRPRLGRKVFASFLPGHAHSVGFIAICHWLDRDGWDVVHPPRVPPERQLVEQIVAAAPDVIALTCSIPRNVVQARRVIRDVRTQGLIAPVWIGGMPINAIPGLFERTGADRTAKDIIAFTQALAADWGYQSLTPAGLAGDN